jgi:hypothetical protein
VPDIVTYDPVTGRVIGYRPSQDPAAWMGRPDVLVVSSAEDVAALRGLVTSVSTRYLRVSGGVVSALSAADRDAQDAAETADAEAAIRASAAALVVSSEPIPLAVRALAIVINASLNEIRVKVGLPTRSLSDAMTAVRDLIESGQV